MNESAFIFSPVELDQSQALLKGTQRKNEIKIVVGRRRKDDKRRRKELERRKCLTQTNCVGNIFSRISTVHKHACTQTCSQRPK